MKMAFKDDTCLDFQKEQNWNFSRSQGKNTIKSTISVLTSYFISCSRACNYKTNLAYARVGINKKNSGQMVLN